MQKIFAILDLGTYSFEVMLYFKILLILNYILKLY